MKDVIKKAKDEAPKPTADIIVGEVYKDSCGRIFVAMAKDDYTVYDATGWCYTPDSIKKISN